VTAVNCHTAAAHPAGDERPSAAGRLSLDAFDEFGPLGRHITIAAPPVLVLERELTELGAPLAAPYTPAEHLL